MICNGVTPLARQNREPQDFFEIGGSPVPGLTLRHVLRGHESRINRIAWSPNGCYLASPSGDNTIRVWDVESGACISTLIGHQDVVYTVTWASENRKLVSGSWDRKVIFWDVDGTPEHVMEYAYPVNAVSSSPLWERIAIGSEGPSIGLLDVTTRLLTDVLRRHRGNINNLAWSPSGRMIATASADSTLGLWDSRTAELVRTMPGHSDWVFAVAWSPDEESLFSCSWDRTIRKWDALTGSQTRIVEGHLSKIQSITVLSTGSLIASKSTDGTVKLWNADTLSEIVTLPESTSGHNSPSVAFHPLRPFLATLGERDTVIRIWELDEAVLAGQTAAHVNYTTAKLVLVGDSGVGKTGLGWRLAHDEFKVHSSTHGQQFWTIPQLNLKRKDGTECEAVLWDLAGQHVYRQVHSIFLENVTTALVLFDPSNRQDPLKGVQFWLEQLRGKGQLPPTMLVGAKVDRGASALSQQELTQFCQRYGISGGYVSTSALTGEGIELLLTALKEQIPWDKMTATVTTVTFKRVKDYVLVLKEKPDRKGVLVSPQELRRQLEAMEIEELWEFADADMMTAVGHLETHGYVAILRSSAGAQHILLAPDLLVSLAASIILLADKNPRELGAVSESELLQGRYSFDEFKGLDPAEQQILLDAAVLRFLEHNLCFRETFNDDTLLIFPSLIKQKRPLQDDVSAIDDICYVVRGRVENLYASLVVLLGYTPTFSRINQWQYQAQYEMGAGQLCGFRMIEDREGEIELVLYYGDQLPLEGRARFQELFEQFLYQRDVEVTRFPPVQCVNEHRLERATVIKRVRDGKDFAFCEECGEKTALPDFAQPQTIGIGASPWLQREEAAARLRSAYEMQLTRVKSYRRMWTAPRAYVSSLAAQAIWVEKLVHDLRDAGVLIVERSVEVKPDDFVIVLETPEYQHAFKTKALAVDAALVRERFGKRTLISLALTGQYGEHALDDCKPGSFCDETHYPVSLFDLVLNLYAIPFTHAGFAPLRKSLHEQWERTAGRVEQEVATAHGNKRRAYSRIPAKEDLDMETYHDFELQIAPNGHVVARTSEGEAVAVISTQPPEDIQLALKLIENRATNTELLKQLGRSLYSWLFPPPIHTHFHQTEAVARVKQAKIRLRLCVESPSIASLPLEFLYREMGGYYLAVNPDTVLSRYLNLPLPRERVRRREGPLHVLVIISDPTDLTRVNPEEWEGVVQDALAKPLADGEMTLRTVRHATRREIRNALLEGKPDIIQFFGHGIYEDGKGYVAMVSEDTGRMWKLDDERFTGLFNGFDDHLGLISLATCESAQSDNPQGFLGLAPQLVQRGVPAVIAMQYIVYMRTTKVFLEDLYTAVAAGKPVDWAVQAARNAVSLQYGFDDREFATPVLYMRAKDGVILTGS